MHGSSATRIGLLVGGLVAIIAAFVLLQPSDDDAAPAATATVATVVATTTTPTGTVTTTKTTVTKKPAVDPGPLLTAKGVTKLSAKPGEIVRFRARSAVDEEVHVHGYDLSFDAPAGKTIRVRFKASIEGGFEIEFEGSGTPIGELAVQS